MNTTDNGEETVEEAVEETVETTDDMVITSDLDKITKLVDHANDNDPISFDIMDPDPVAEQEPPLLETKPRHSTRTRIATKQYVPSMTGTKYGYAVTQLSNGIMHPRIFAVQIL